MEAREDQYDGKAERGVGQEVHEVPSVVVTDTGTDPGAVVLIRSLLYGPFGARINCRLNSGGCELVQLTCTFGICD